jgi:hypothetical protein
VSFWARLTGRAGLPAGFAGALEASERVLATAATAGGDVVVTTAGLWVPHDGGHRRIGWHLVSKARWDGRALHLVEAEQVGSQGRVVLLADREPMRIPLPAPGQVPDLVQRRVTKSVLASERRELPGGSALFVRRQVPGRDGVQLQVRPDPGTDLEDVRRSLP